MKLKNILFSVLGSLLISLELFIMLSIDTSIFIYMLFFCIFYIIFITWFHLGDIKDQLKLMNIATTIRSLDPKQLNKIIDEAIAENKARRK